MNIENQSQAGPFTDKSKYFGENLLGSFLILMIAMALTALIIWPEVEESINLAIQTRGIKDWMYAFEGLFVTGFVLAFPLFLVFQSITHYWQAN